MKMKYFTIICVVQILLCGSTFAAIVVDGNVTPLPWGPTTWGKIGIDAPGSLTMDGGSSLSPQYCTLGFFTGGIGTLNMSGGSTITSETLLLADQDTTTSGTAVLSGSGTKVTTVTGLATVNVGFRGTGELRILDGAQVETTWSQAGKHPGAKGTIKVDGAGSKFLANNFISLGQEGQSANRTQSFLEVTNGGAFESLTQIGIGYGKYSYNEALVSGEGSLLHAETILYVGRLSNEAHLVIEHSGLVSVTGQLMLNSVGSAIADIKMSTGGKLALNGTGYASIGDFLNLVVSAASTKDILYWNGSAWVNIANGTASVDYTLAAGTGDLAGYSVLTVNAPEECKYTIVGDINSNCKVDFQDFAVMISNWLMDCVYPNNLTNPACN